MQALDIGHGPMGMTGRLLLTFRLAWRLLLLLAQQPSLSLIHIHSSAGRPLFEKGVFVLIGVLWRKQVLLHLHGGRMREAWASYGRIRRGVTRFILDCCAGVIVLSDSWISFYREEMGYRGPLHSLPNSVTVERSAVEREDARVSLLYVGHLKPEKGLLDLRQAWSLLPERVKSRSRLMLMGEADTPENGALIRAAFADLPSDQARFLGALGGVAKWAAFAQADALVLPSHSEDLPLTLLEGMALGLPLIATRVGAIPTLVTDRREGMLVAPRDVVGLAVVMEEVLDDVELRSRLGEAGNLKFVDHHSFEQYLNRLSNIYAGLLSG